MEYTPEQIKYFENLFDKAVELQDGLIYLGPTKRTALSDSDKSKLQEAIKIFQECIDFAPHHWQSMVFCAKSYQRLGEHDKALELLETAFEIEVEESFIPLEASLEAMALQQIDKALFYSEEAIKRRPNNIELYGNHAMNLLISGENDQQALEIVNTALEMEPSDEINQNIATKIREVIEDASKRPTFDEMF